jgi:hypothetical protein
MLSPSSKFHSERLGSKPDDHLDNPDTIQTEYIELPGAFWGCSVPIYRLLERGVFDPELVAMMGDVFEDVLNTFGLVDRDDPLTTMIARKVIELAQASEHDAVRLKQLRLEAFDGKAN